MGFWDWLTETPYDELTEKEKKLKEKLSPDEFRRYMKNKKENKMRGYGNRRNENAQRANQKISAKATQQPVKKDIQKCVPKCPTCGSTDLVKKGVGARAIDGFVFGRLSVEGRSQFRCRNCSYEW